MKSIRANVESSLCFLWFCIRAVFTWVSKEICVYFNFALLRLVIGLKISRHFLNQAEVNQNNRD